MAKASTTDKAAADKAAADKAAADKAAADKAAAQKAPGKIWVQVKGQRIGEDHGNYNKGEVFPTTRERADALGDLVEEVEEPVQPAESTL
jgi:membrane protein involved in colicin uptake